MATSTVAICHRHPHAGRVTARLVQEGFWVLAGLRCDDPSLSARLRRPARRTLVTAACADGRCASLMEEAAERAGVPAWACSILFPSDDLLESAERIAARLIARARRLDAAPAVLPDQTVSRYGMRRQVLTRRGLFSRSTWLVVEVVPGVEPARCRAAFGCRYCADACPHHAIRFQHGAAAIDRDRCTGCGICAAACPVEAVSHAPADAAAVGIELQVLLGGTTHPRFIVFRCRSDWSRLPAPCLDIPLPCVAAVSTTHVLDAFRHGADGVAIFGDARGCPHRHSRSWLEERVAAWRVMVQAFGLEPARITLAGGAEQLRSWAEIVTAMPPRAAARADTKSPTGTATLRTRLAALAADAPLPPGVLHHEAAPLALVDCDPLRCTLCGVCANVCPTGALQCLQTSDRAALSFDHALCTGCRRCEEICPEQALHVTRGIAAALFQGPRVVAEDAMLRCRACGIAIAPRRLAGWVEARLLEGSAGRAGVPVHDLCAACRLTETLKSAMQH